MIDPVWQGGPPEHRTPYSPPYQGDAKTHSCEGDRPSLASSRGPPTLNHTVQGSPTGQDPPEADKPARGGQDLTEHESYRSLLYKIKEYHIGQ